MPVVSSQGCVLGVGIGTPIRPGEWAGSNNNREPRLYAPPIHRHIDHQHRETRVTTRPRAVNYGDKKYVKLRARFRARCEAVSAVCHLCGQPISYGVNSPDPFELDHFYPVSKRPELYLDTGNWRASHSSCNRSRGDKDVTPVLGTPSEEW